MYLTVLKEDGDELLDFKEYFAEHRNSKIYIAKITVLHPKNDFLRYYLPKEENTKYWLDSFIMNKIYEIKVVNYTNDGQRTVKHHGFYIFRGVNENEEAYFEEISKDEVYDILTEPKRFSRYLAYLLEERKHKWFLSLLRQHADKAIYLAQELARNSNARMGYISFPLAKQRNETRDILRKIAEKHKEARKGYAALIYELWDHGVIFYRGQKEIRYLINVLEPSTREEIIEHLIKLLVNDYPYMRIVSELTREAGRELSNFDYKAFFEKHQFFEKILQLPYKLQVDVYYYIFTFIMFLITDNLFTNGYKAKGKFVYDFFTMLKEKTGNDGLAAFMGTWKKILDNGSWTGTKLYKKVMRYFFKELIKKEDLFQLYVEFSSNMRGLLTIFFDDTALSSVHAEIAIEALKKGEYQIFYDIFIDTKNRAAITEKLMSSNTLLKKFFDSLLDYVEEYGIWLVKPSLFWMEELLEKRAEKGNVIFLDKIIEFLIKAKSYKTYLGPGDDIVERLLEKTTIVKAKVSSDSIKGTDNSVFSL